MSYLRQFFDFLFNSIRLLFMPQRWGGALRKMTQMSLPAGSALMVALFLIVCVAAFLVAARDPKLDMAPWWQTFPIVVLLVFVIPIVTYFGVKLWIEGELSAFDDIDRAWRVGTAELLRNGLSLQKIPVFLILGSEGPEREVDLFAAADLNLTVKNFPPGPSALHWYANQDAVYVVCTTVGCVSRLAALAANLDEEPTARDGPPQGRPQSNIRATVWPSELESPSTPDAAPAARDARPVAAPPPDIRGTVDVRGTMFVASEEAQQATVALQQNTRSGGKKLHFDRLMIESQRRRLEHLCRLVRRSRRPLCPINGLAVLLPLDMLLADDDDGSKAKEAAQTDADTVLRTIKLRCPVTVLITGWEAETGFHELVRRVGENKARKDRFGKGFEPWAPPLPEEIEALCQHACGAFEDWVYYLFRDRDALRKPGNRLLYALLCRVRLYLERRLDQILVGAFSREPGSMQGPDPLLFSGCYFVAAGTTDDRQAFVRSVLRKFPENQEELDWTSSALREDAWYRRLAYGCLILSAALVAAEVFMLNWK